MIRIFKNIIIHYQTIEKGEGVYKLHNLHHTDHICHTHCWLTRGGLASVILISSAIFLLVNTDRRSLFLFSFLELKAVFIQRQLIFERQNQPNGCNCLMNTNLLLILRLDESTCLKKTWEEKGRFWGVFKAVNCFLGLLMKDCNRTCLKNSLETNDIHHSW